MNLHDPGMLANLHNIYLCMGLLPRALDPILTNFICHLYNLHPISNTHHPKQKKTRIETSLNTSRITRVIPTSIINITSPPLDHRYEVITTPQARANREGDGERTLHVHVTLHIDISSFYFLILVYNMLKPTLLQRWDKMIPPTQINYKILGGSN